MLRTIFFVILIAAILSGCATAKDPYIVYEENIPLAETSVFSVAQNSQLRVGWILAIDGKELPCFTFQCPPWVRVKPGKHTFRVHYSEKVNLNMYRYADFDVFVSEMEARHVYIPDINIVNKKISMIIKDLGENPKYGVPTLGLKHDYLFVKF